MRAPGARGSGASRSRKILTVCRPRLPCRRELPPRRARPRVSGAGTRRRRLGSGRRRIASPSAPTPAAGTDIASHRLGTCSYNASPNTAQSASKHVRRRAARPPTPWGLVRGGGGGGDGHRGVVPLRARRFVGVGAGERRCSPAILRTGLGVRPTHSLIRLASERADRACREAHPTRGGRSSSSGWMKGFSLARRTRRRHRPPPPAPSRAPGASSAFSRAAEASSAARADSDAGGTLGSRSAHMACFVRLWGLAQRFSERSAAKSERSEKRDCWRPATYEKNPPVRETSRCRASLLDSSQC